MKLKTLFFVDSVQKETFKTMKLQSLVLLFIIAFSTYTGNAQPEGYVKLITIKQPYHTYNSTNQQDTRKAFQKVNGLKFSESQKLLAISYAYNPTSIVIYKVETWEQLGVYKVTGAGVELNSSYFEENDKVLYVKYDRYSTKYKRVEFDTGYIRKVPCKRTPKGCVYEEVSQDAKNAMLNNKKFYVEVSPFDASDVDIYIKKIK